MRISDWSSDVCSSDLAGLRFGSERYRAHGETPIIQPMRGTQRRNLLKHAKPVGNRAYPDMQPTFVAKAPVEHPVRRCGAQIACGGYACRSQIGRAHV